jgi:hypothetical protein
VIVKMVRKRLQRPDTRKAHGWLLDGFPRTASQALALDANSIRPHVFILLEVPDVVALERAAGRRVDPKTGAIYHLAHAPPPEEAVARLEQRSDDRDEGKMLNRLKARPQSARSRTARIAAPHSLASRASNLCLKQSCVIREAICAVTETCTLSFRESNRHFALVLLCSPFTGAARSPTHRSCISRTFRPCGQSTSPSSGRVSVRVRVVPACSAARACPVLPHDSILPQCNPFRAAHCKRTCASAHASPDACPSRPQPLRGLIAAACGRQPFDRGRFL